MSVTLCDIRLRNTALFELFDHTADLGIRVRAGSLEQLFAEAAQALLSTIVLNSDDVESNISRVISIQSPELELTLVDWLSELLFLYETEGLVFSKFHVSLDGTNLQATCYGQHVDEAIHKLHHEVKAITYHQLKVVRVDGQWLAEVIVDI